MKISSNDDSWLKQYHSRLQSEYEHSSNKKDTLTNWSLTIMLAMIGLYFGDFVGIDGYESESRFALVVGTLIIEIQFFVNSMLAYGFLKKWREIKEKIESYWMDGKPDLATLCKEIKELDHGRSSSTGWRAKIWAQLRAGFLIILGAPIIISVIELHTVKELSIFHWYVFIVLGAFIAWELFISVNYDQFKKR